MEHKEMIEVLKEMLLKERGQDVREDNTYILLERRKVIEALSLAIEKLEATKNDREAYNENLIALKEEIALLKKKAKVDVGEIEKLIREHQIDIGWHSYGAMKRKQIRDCCNVDIKDLAQAIADKLKGQNER